MRILVLGVNYLVILFAALTFVTEGSANTIEILSFPYPPFLVTADTGIIPEIINDAAKEAGLETRIVVRPRKRAVKMFKSDAFQLFLGEGRYFPEMRSDLDIQKLIYARVVIVYLKSKYPTFNFNDNDLVRGKTVGVSLGSNLIPVFQNNGWVVQTTRKNNYNLRKLMLGRIDFWGTVGLSAINLIREIFPENADDFLMWEMEKFSIELIAKKNTPRKSSFRMLQSGFEKSVQNGKYKIILENFYGKENVAGSVITELSQRNRKVKFDDARYQHCKEK